MTITKREQRLYEFGPFRLDTAEQLLLRDGEAVALTPKAFETLVVLVERRGRLVGKDELMGALWPESNVEESNLTNNVWALRKTLGAGQNGLRYIETIPKRGYRFVAAVTEVPPADKPLVVERHTFTRIITDEAEERETLPEDETETYVRSATRAAVELPARAGASTSLKAGIVAVGLLLLAVPLALYRPWSSGETKRAAAVVPAVATPRSIAVLPFKTIGAGGEGGEYLGVGMSDAVITGLGSSRLIVVRPTSAVRRYTDPLQDPLVAGREQRVEAVLDGSVQRVGDLIRVTVQLYRTRDGASLWSAKFDERFTDIFAVQDSISRQVMRELLIELSPEEARRLERRRGPNFEAYEAYLKGVYFWNKRSKDGYQKALEHFSRAIELDPTYAEAYVGLGNAYAYLGGHDRASQAEAISKQRAGAMKALELDDTLAEAHATLGLIAMNTEGDWPKAEREFKRAIELNPNYATAHQWYGEFLADMGRFDEGIAEIERAHELDPLSLVISTDVAKVYAFARRFDEATEQYKRALELDPEFEVAHGLLALTYSMRGMHDEAIGELRKIRNLENDPMYLSFLSFVYGKAGRRAEAQKVVGRMRELSGQTYVLALWMAIAHAGAGEKGQALQWLDRVFEERTVGGVISLKEGYVWDDIRPDPRFPSLLRRAGF